MHIDTEIRPVIVEIDGREYPVAPKTVGVLEKLRRSEDDAVKAGRMRHELIMEHLELLLGRPAVREIFPSGRDENVDRMEAVYAGVLDAFDANSRQRREARTDAVTGELRQLADQLRPLADLLSIMRTNDPGGRPVIRRPGK